MRNVIYIGSAPLLAAVLCSVPASAAPVAAVNAVPFITSGGVGMLSLVSVGVAGAIWLARRKQ